MSDYDNQPTADVNRSPSDDPTIASPAAGVVRTLREGPGTLIGHYKLVRLIGEGGFGSVFLAEQEEPLQRKVALKIIKLGMDTSQVIARFEQERQALAILDHPNIAKVFDAGATATGRPFFVMELCTGEPIDDYCDRNNLNIPERLEIFAQVCAAVQHAHTKGLIHRDIKPSNVLVSTQDGKPSAKVIDFGIAKATSSRMTERTLYTEHKQMIGTPEYMSPEQAEGSLDIDTRTDVYSLGVLLYELLTGVTPFSGRKLRSAAYDEIQRIIREEEPTKPSTRLIQNNDSAADVAARRRSEPKKLESIIRGELDWIVMKALEKDRQRRYETANGLAMDIRRYLAGEPVNAAPPSAAYRMRKFVKRHRGAVAAGSSVAAALVVGVIAFAWQASIARDQRDRAVFAEGQATLRADELKQVADFQAQMLKQIDVAAAGLRLSADVRTKYDAVLAKDGVSDDARLRQVDSFTGQWSRINATNAALELINGTILKPAVSAIEEQFADQPLIAANLRQVLAERYHDLGMDAEALAMEEQTLAQRRMILGDEHPDTLVSIGNIGGYISGLGKKDAAESYYREALEKSRRVRGADDPETMTCISNLGDLQLQMGNFTDAEQYFREALERRTRVLGEDHEETLTSTANWAMLLRAQGKLADAETYSRDALAKRRRVLGEDQYDTLRSINELAAILKEQGKLAEAITYFREVVEKRRRLLGDAHPATLSAMQNLGTTLNANGYPDEAESLIREALTKQQQLLGADHISTLVSSGNLSVFLIRQKKFADAEPLCRETLERRMRVLGENHPETLIANNVMGLVLIRQKRFDEGEPYWRNALAIAQRILGPTHPDTLIYTHNLAGLAIDRNKPDEAERLLREVIQIGASTLGAGHPTVLSATGRLGGVLLDQKRYDEVVELLTKAEPEARKRYTGTNAQSLGELLENLGAARMRLGHFAAAEPNLIEAYETFVKTGGPQHTNARGGAETLAILYDLWDQAELGKGYNVKATEWKAKLDELNLTEPAKPEAK